MLPSNRGQASRIVCIDDDESFLQLVQSSAKRRGLDVDGFSSLAEMGSFARLGHYDVAIIDYHLDKMTGAEIAEYFDIFFQATPVIIVSSALTCRDACGHWPKSVAQCLSKEAGIGPILEAAESFLKTTS